MRKIVYIAFVLFSFSCRKDVTLQLPEYTQKVVVEGGIETGQPAVVFLSYSVPYFSDFDYSAPEKAFIKNALVTVSDGILVDTLTQIDPDNGYLYAGFKVFGIEGRKYTLKVEVNGKRFETTTEILGPMNLDSLYFKEERDSLGLIWQTFSEPFGSGDCYRWYAKRLGRDFFYAAPFNSVFDDKFIDGKTFEFGYDRGPQPNQIQQNRQDPERGYYKKGDTVVVKFCKIGRSEYNFWYSYYQNKLSNGNPFSSPSNIQSMFSNHQDVFGAFVGYSPSFDTIIIPK